VGVEASFVGMGGGVSGGG